RQLGKVDAPPHQPGEQAFEMNRPASSKRNGELGTRGLMPNDAERATGVEVKRHEWSASEAGVNVARERSRFTQCELRGRRARLATRRVGDAGTIAQRPQARMARYRERVIDNDRTTPVSFARQAVEQRVGCRAGSPYQCLCTDLFRW